MNSIFFSSQFNDYYAFFKNVVSVLVFGCLGGTILFLLTKEWSRLTNTKLRFEYEPLFKALINKHIYLNPKLYLTDLQYIDLPLEEFKKHHLDCRGIRKILIDAILECHQRYPEEKRRLLKKLYEDLDLDLFTIIDLNLLNGKSLASAILELSNMEIMVEECRIIKFLKHKNSAVQYAARIYMLKMLEVSYTHEMKSNACQTSPFIKKPLLSL